jgi:hypothetical protein
MNKDCWKEVVVDEANAQIIVYHYSAEYRQQLVAASSEKAQALFSFSPGQARRLAQLQADSKRGRCD